MHFVKERRQLIGSLSRKQGPKIWRRILPQHTLTVCRGSAAAMIAAVLLMSAATGRAATLTLSPGVNIQSAINANPNGTAFILRPGVYRMQAVVPKPGDSFTGQTGADLNGSRVLTNWTLSGSYWTSAGAPALNSPWGPATQYCVDVTTGCAYP
jgi:hypothetical protein